MSEWKAVDVVREFISRCSKHEDGAFEEFLKSPLMSGLADPIRERGHEFLTDILLRLKRNGVALDGDTEKVSHVTELINLTGSAILTAFADAIDSMAATFAKHNVDENSQRCAYVSVSMVTVQAMTNMLNGWKAVSMAGIPEFTRAAMDGSFEDEVPYDD